MFHRPIPKFSPNAGIQVLLDVHEVAHDASRLLGSKSSVEDLICLGLLFKHLLIIYLGITLCCQLQQVMSLNRKLMLWQNASCLTLPLDCIKGQFTWPAIT